MKKIFNIALATITVACIGPASAQKGGYQLKTAFHIASAGGWDYLATDPGANKLYVSHGTQVNILDKTTGDSLGVIENTTGVHGIAFDDALGKGYTSNGRLNNVSVFELKTGKVLSQIATGENPDAILYDEFSKKVITCNGRGKDLTVIDPVTEKVVATIPMGGKPETAVTDNAGKLYVNVEDKNEIVVVDIVKFEVLSHWTLSPAEGPTGLAIDRQSKRLFAGCDKLLVVMNAETGAIVSKLPIGDGCDGVAFDPASKTIFTSNGEGTMTVVKEVSPSEFKVMENVVTKKSARTITLDEKTHKIYLLAADFDPVAADAPPRTRPKMIPGSFQVLVFEK
ncbi:MAG: YncE family protein [Chitinophagaceae bacterium]